MNRQTDTLAASARHVGAALESAALSFVSRAAPWLGPLPTAWLVYDRTMRHLLWPAWVATAAALTIECLGLAASATALRFWVYKREKLVKEPDVLLLLPVTLTVVYFVAAESLTVILDLATLPANEIKAAHFAPALFPVLSLVSVALLAIRQANAYVFLTKEERKTQRKTAKAERSEQAQKEPEQTGKVAEVAVEQTHFAHCKKCDWWRDGYETARGATNALNAHKCETVARDNGREPSQVFERAVKDNVER